MINNHNLVGAYNTPPVIRRFRDESGGEESATDMSISSVPASPVREIISREHSSQQFQRLMQLRSKAYILRLIRMTVRSARDTAGWIHATQD